MGGRFVVDDCKKLKEKFLSKNSTSYADFKKAWEEISFGAVFAK